MGSGTRGSRRAAGLAKYEGGVLPRELPVSLGDHHARQRLLSPSLSPAAVGILRDTSRVSENAQLATALIEQAASQQQITPKILTLHAAQDPHVRSRRAAARQAGVPTTSLRNPTSLSSSLGRADDGVRPVRLSLGLAAG